VDLLDSAMMEKITKNYHINHSKASKVQWTIGLTTAQTG
jgi:hypothetical protein